MQEPFMTFSGGNSNGQIDMPVVGYVWKSCTVRLRVQKACVSKLIDIPIKSSKSNTLNMSEPWCSDSCNSAIEEWKEAEISQS
jgi:hypothetical protein